MLIIPSTLLLRQHIVHSARNILCSCWIGKAGLGGHRWRRQREGAITPKRSTAHLLDAHKIRYCQLFICRHRAMPLINVTDDPMSLQMHFAATCLTVVDGSTLIDYTLMITSHKVISSLQVTFIKLKTVIYRKVLFGEYDLEHLCKKTSEKG